MSSAEVGTTPELQLDPVPQSVEVLPFQETAAARALPARPKPRAAHRKNNRNPTIARVLLVIITTFSGPDRPAVGPRIKGFSFRSVLSLELSLGWSKS